MASLVITLSPAEALTAIVLAKDMHDDPLTDPLDREKAWKLFQTLFAQLYGTLDHDLLDTIEHQLTGNLC